MSDRETRSLKVTVLLNQPWWVGRCRANGESWAIIRNMLQYGLRRKLECSLPVSDVFLATRTRAWVCDGRRDMVQLASADLVDNGRHVLRSREFGDQSLQRLLDKGAVETLDRGASGHEYT